MLVVGEVHAIGVAVTAMVYEPEVTMAGVVAESVALMAKVYVPAAPETVPVMAPVLLMPRQVGSAPLAITMVLEPVPPLTVMVAPG